MVIARLLATVAPVYSNTKHSGRPHSHRPSVTTMSKTPEKIKAGTNGAVEMRLVAKQYERPPVMKLTFDVKLHNRSAETVWFLLPDRIAIPPLPVRTGIFGVVVSALSGRGRVVIARFAGTGRFQAILLPANGEIMLRHLPITFRGELPKTSLPVEVVLAQDFTISGEPAAHWLGIDPVSDAKADVSMENPERLLSKDMPGLAEVPVIIVGAQRIEI